MSIRVTRLPEHGVNLTVYSGRLTREVLLAHYRGLNAADAANASRWISYFDPSVDLSEIDFAVFPELKRVLTAKLVEIYGGRRLTAAIVCDSRVNQPILSFWRSYTGSDAEHPADPELFSCLKGACDFLGLPDAAREGLAAGINASVTGAAPASRRADALA
jgi:hypothetical protein